MWQTKLGVTLVPLQWSLDLCDDLQTLGKTVECFTYPGQPHTLQGESDQFFIQRMIDFFDSQRLTTVR